MTMYPVPVQRVSIGGTVLSWQETATDGNTAPIGDHNFVLVWNDGGSNIDVTIAVYAKDNLGRALSSDVVTVPDGSWSMIGPLKREFANPTDHQVHITYSDASNSAVAVIGV